MSELCRKITPAKRISWKLLKRISIIFSYFWDRVISSSIRKKPAVRYRRLSQLASSQARESMESALISQENNSCFDYESDSDLVDLKISLLGDCRIGKTSFMVKYVGGEEEKKSLQMKGLNLMDKTLLVRGARIAFRIWDVGGDRKSFDQVPIACKDAVAILFMFDLTSRSTLNNVIGWYREARKWNKTAIPILIGTKFDDFVHLPPHIQWTVITQARTYARAMRATLFFSSATHNINVNKIFKFIMAKLFNLPWTVECNLTIGEPIIDVF